MARKIHDEDDARRCLAAWRASGDPLGSWARQHDIDGRSLHCWKLNLGRAPRSAAVLELVPVKSAPAAAPARYTVRVDGVEVEVGDDFREETLHRLLRVVAAC